ncbi:MAG: beta-galactosidase [Candidatus Magasanikbacteria bacterium]|nr:beta-galactosidase [Candidatus Magasanikbacteria bacterium]
MNRSKLILVIIVYIALALGLVFLVVKIKNFKRSGTMIYGVSFNTEYAQYLGFDPRVVFSKILQDWNFKHIRLSAQWNLIERTKGDYDFRDLDWMMDQSAKKNAKVVLAIGHKTPRWPECHDPSWVDSASAALYKPELENFMRAVIKKYKNHPALEVWQVENEPFLRFGDCMPMSDEDLKQEVGLVKSLDPNHPVIVTDSGELSLWRHTAKAADLFGTTMYRVVWNQTLGYFSYDWIMPAFVYKAKLWLNGRDINAAYITELQAEPWIPDKKLADASVDEQFKSMNLERLKKNIRFADKTGMPRAYLWGAEWWYWLESKGEREIPDYIKNLEKE